MEKSSDCALNKQAVEFFLYEYFGIVSKDYTDEIKEDSRETKIKKCVRRAYLDMNRTLVLNKDESPFYDSIGNDLAEFLSEDSPVINLREKAYSVFFDNDGQVKESVRKLLLPKAIKDPKKRQGSAFYYGQAQKWINMSLKYMWLIGLISDCSDLEPPIDTYIMKGAPDSVQFPKDNGTSDCGKYIEGSSMPWSKLSKDETITIQNGIKKSIDTNKYHAPILWECDTWIIQSETEKRNNSD